MSNLAREPLEIIEIDVDQCALTYGVGACTASLDPANPRKCYNTRATCQDRANYTPGVLTLRFSKNIAGLPKGQTIFPALQSVSTSPTKITLTGLDDRTGSLGKRERMTIRFQDFIYDDALTDKYVAGRRDGTAQNDEPGYDPSRGTFFGKLRARQPYFFGRAIRRKVGYVGDDIAAMPTEHHVMVGFKGPDSNGAVEIIAQDPFRLADKEYALCPRPSAGKIGAAIAETGTPSLTLIPAGIGADYATAGRARIGTEIVSFTRSGDTVTITGRAIGGTTASSHGLGDTFQQCFGVFQEEPAQVLSALIGDFTGIPASWLDVSAWSAEASRWAPSMRLTRTVSQPTPVIDLIAEIMDMGFTMWPDKRAGKIRLRANRPTDVDETLPELSDETTVIEGTMNREDLDKLRLTRVLALHSMFSYAADPSDSDNYRVGELIFDAEAEGDNEDGQQKIHVLHMPWLGLTGNESVAQIVAARLLTRFKDTPQEISFQSDIKDREPLAPGRLASIETRSLQDVTGASSARGIQITSVDEVVAGHRLAVTAQTHNLDGRWGFILPPGFDDFYDDASATDIAKGCFMLDPAIEEFFPDDTGPYIMF